MNRKEIINLGPDPREVAELNSGNFRPSRLSQFASSPVGRGAAAILGVAGAWAALEGLNRALQDGPPPVVRAAEPTPTLEPTPSPEPTPEATPTLSPTPPPTETPTPFPTPTATATPSATPSPSPTSTPSPTPSPEGQLKVVKFHDRNANAQQDAGEEGLIWGFNVDGPGANDFRVQTQGDGTVISTVPPGNYNVCEDDQQGWRATIAKCLSVFVPQSSRAEARFGNKQELPTPTPTPTTPTPTPSPTPPPEREVQVITKKTLEGLGGIGQDYVAWIDDGDGVRESHEPSQVSRTNSNGTGKVIFRGNFGPGTIACSEEFNVSGNFEPVVPKDCDPINGSLTAENQLVNRNKPTLTPTPTPTPTPEATPTPPPKVAPPPTPTPILCPDGKPLPKEFQEQVVGPDAQKIADMLREQKCQTREEHEAIRENIQQHDQKTDEQHAKQDVAHESIQRELVILQKESRDQYKTLLDRLGDIKNGLGNAASAAREWALIGLTSATLLGVLGLYLRRRKEQGARPPEPPTPPVTGPRPPEQPRPSEQPFQPSKGRLGCLLAPLGLFGRQREEVPEPRPQVPEEAAQALASDQEVQVTNQVKMLDDEGNSKTWNVTGVWLNRTDPNKPHREYILRQVENDQITKHLTDADLAQRRRESHLEVTQPGLGNQAAQVGHELPGGLRVVQVSRVGDKREYRVRDQAGRERNLTEQEVKEIISQAARVTEEARPTPPEEEAEGPSQLTQEQIHSLYNLFRTIWDRGLTQLTDAEVQQLVTDEVRNVLRDLNLITPQQAEDRTPQGARVIAQIAQRLNEQVVQFINGHQEIVRGWEEGWKEERIRADERARIAREQEQQGEAVQAAGEQPQAEPVGGEAREEIAEAGQTPRVEGPESIELKIDGSRVTIRRGRELVSDAGTKYRVEWIAPNGQTFGLFNEKEQRIVTYPRNRMIKLIAEDRTRKTRQREERIRAAQQGAIQ